ncbi:hypothetical protein ACERZ8_03500 [Tateyamaria armeniaca]|uniref:Uncharacterized protein n=1 Tax=Tateyamaria armeniaca TaxID=2518930 RepID=A0ABW8UUV7_9RHOB
MKLRVIANELRDVSLDAPMEREVRACFANLLIGLERGHVSVDSVKRRLAEMAENFNRTSFRDFRSLLLELDTAMSVFGLQDHYFRPGPLNEHLDNHAITIQANEDGMLGRFLLSPPRRAGSDEIAEAFRQNECVGWVGRADRPLWLTPYFGEVADLIEQAQDTFCSPSQKASIARRVVALLGLSHIQPTTELLAFVTRESVGQLLFDRPDDRNTQMPTGSTAIEARGHRRFRAWPRNQDNPYGRTFEIDDAARAAAEQRGEYAGALEIVRPNMDVGAFISCTSLGPLTAKPVDRAGSYLRDLGIEDKSAAELLLKLAEVIEL